MLNAGASIDLLLGIIDRASDSWPPNLPSMLNGAGEPPSPGLILTPMTGPKCTAEGILGDALKGFSKGWDVSSTTVGPSRLERAGYFGCSHVSGLIETLPSTVTTSSRLLVLNPLIMPQ